MASEEEDKKAERLRRARDLAAARGFGPSAATSGQAPAKAPPAIPTIPPQSYGARTEPPSDKVGFFDLLVGLFKPKPAQPPVTAQPAPGVEHPSFTIIVAALAGDADGSAAAYLNQALAARPSLKTKALGKVFVLDNLEDPSLVSSVVLNTRHAVAEEDGDLLVWGDFSKDGYRLRLATATADDERAAAFGPATRVELPKDFAEPASNLLFAAVLAAIDPATEAQKAAIRRLLPPAAIAAEALAARPPVQLTMTQQRAVQLVFGHVATAAAIASLGDEAKAWFDKAVNFYRQAQRRLNRTDPGWEAGLLHKHVAAAIAAKAERQKEPAPLWEEAITEWRSAVENLPRALMPQEWASAQVKLGGALYRLDLLTGQTELLREALQALQATLQVYSRTETPQRWAEIMNTIAQVLEVYGDQIKNTEVLQRAVDACRSVLEIRTRDRTPLAWAATQNTLGSALFMLDRHSNGGGHLTEAEVALSGALEVFQAYSAKGPAKVAAKNLSHVRKMIETRKSHQGVDPHWLDDPSDKRR